MFETTVREQGDAQQREYWLPKIRAWEAIGCYAQTELGHGSNVKGLECRATWDPQNREFVLHSPTLTASKWWNGTMGRTANHAIVVAQLYVPESTIGGEESRLVNRGPHPFIVQIRDLKTHLPLEGIVVGDIGPKYGYAPMDNGFVSFSLFLSLSLPSTYLPNSPCVVKPHVHLLTITTGTCSSTTSESPILPCSQITLAWTPTPAPTRNPPIPP